MNTNNNDKWNAQHYKKHSEGQFKHGVSAIHGINFHGNETVLDVGCGDGRITAEIAKLVPQGHVIGLDVSQNMITEAKSSFGNIKNLEFICADATEFSIDKKFDLIVSFAAMHWVKDQQCVLNNFYNHLKPNGRLIIRTGAVHSGPIPDVFMSKKWFPLLSQKPQRYFPQTAESFCKMLENAGFKEIDVAKEIASQTLENKDLLFNAVFAWVPHSTGLPDDKAREFTQDIVDKICSAREDGQIIFEAATLNATAVKL